MPQTQNGEKIVSNGIRKSISAHKTVRLIPHIKIKAKWIKNLNRRPETKTLGKKHRGKSWFGIGNVFSLWLKIQAWKKVYQVGLYQMKKTLSF